MNVPPAQTRDWSTLEILQFVLLCTLAIVCATTFRTVIWVATQQQDLFPDFQGILLFLSDYALIALAALTILRLVIEPDFRRSFSSTVAAVLRRLGGIWWLALIVWMGLSALWAQQPRLALFDGFEALLALVAALLVVYFVQIGAGRGLLIALIIGAVIQSAIGIAQLIHGGPIGLVRLGEIRWVPPIGMMIGYAGPGLYRANALTVNPNNLAGYLMIALFGLAVLANVSGAATRAGSRLFFIALFLIALGFLATMSRSAIAPAAVVFVVLAILQVSYRRFRLRKQHIPLILGALVVLVVGAVLLVLNLQSRVLNVLEDLQERQLLVDQADMVIQNHPLLGTGAGNLMLEVEQNRLRLDPHAALVAAVPAHNVYVIILAELGPVGLILFLLGCFSSVMRLRWRTRFAVLVWACCALAIFLAMLLDFYFWYDHRSRTLLFFVLGMGWAYSLVAQPVISPVTEASAMPIRGVNEI